MSIRELCADRGMLVILFLNLASVTGSVSLPDVNPSAPEPPNYPKVLKGRNETVGVQSLAPAFFLIPFGVVFAAAGAAVTAMVLGHIPVEPSSSNMPLWAAGCIGPLFFGVGLCIVAMGVRPILRRQRLSANRRNFPNQPAMADYFWNPQGELQNRLLKWAQSLLAALAFSAFLAPFNWWAFFSHDDTWMMKIIIGLFDLILVAFWWGAFYTTVWALKFGPARLTWDSFPVRPENLTLRWLPGRGLRTWENGLFTLRCIRERVDKTESGGETTVSIVHECLWEQECRIAEYRADSLQGSHGVNLAFSPGAGAWPTKISDPAPVYWELEVKIPRPGVDFSHRYLVPVYP